MKMPSVVCAVLSEGTVERHFSPRIPLKELLVKQIASVKKKEDAKRTSDTDEIA